MAADRQTEGEGKGKGKERASDSAGNDRGEGKGQQQEMKEIRRPPPLPAVKGTIGAIESPSRRSFYGASPTSSTTVRGNHSRAPSQSQQDDQEARADQRQEGPGGHEQAQPEPQPQRARPVFRSDPTMTSCFDRLRLEKKEEIRCLFGA